MKKFLTPVLFILAVMILPLTFGGGIFGSGTNPQVQSDSLQINDTTSRINFEKPIQDFSITFQDSSNSKTDSLKVFLITGGRTAYTNLYSLLAVHEQSQVTATTNVSLLIPGDGVTTTYNYHSDVPIFAVFVVRVNVGGVTGAVGYPYKTNFSIASF